MSHVLFISMARPSVAQHIQVVSILLAAKPYLGLFCLNLNAIGRIGHVTITIRSQLIGVLEFMVSVSDQGLWSRLRVRF